MYGKREYYETKDDSFMGLGTEYPTIVLDDISDVTFSRAPTVSPLFNNEIDFNISFDDSDNEDYMIVFEENSFSCKIIYVDNLKMDSENENDKVNILSSPSPEPTIGYIDDLDFFKDFENEFPAIVYNDIKSKSDPLNEPSMYEATLEDRCWHRMSQEEDDLETVYSGVRVASAWSDDTSLDHSGRKSGGRDVIGVDLFYLRTMDRETAIVNIYTSIQYLSLSHHANWEEEWSFCCCEGTSHWASGAAHFALVGESSARDDSSLDDTKRASGQTAAGAPGDR
ncbi:hypothetical protein Tco_1249916 [Tanacetum coccineum]